MPVKTEPCAFSEERIYPGHGLGFVNRAGKKFVFATCKNRHLFLSGRKALNQRWTKQWRRAHKKESILRQVKKGKGRRTLKSERGIEGLSLQELLKKKNESAEQRKKTADDAKKAGPVTKAAKKADLNSRLRDLRKKRKEQGNEKEAPAGKGGAKKSGADAKKAGGAKKSGAAAAKKGGAAPAAAKKKGGGKKKAGGGAKK